MKVIDFKDIKELKIPAKTIINWIDEIWKIKQSAVIPPKIKLWEGEEGRHICMPCVIPSEDVAGVKFISRNINSVERYPARNSNILLQKCSETGYLAAIDGLYITNMRTGAVAVDSLLKFAKSNLSTIGILGLGLAGRTFMWLLAEVYEKPLTVKLLRYKDQAEDFKNRFKEYKNITFEIVDDIKEICCCDGVVSAISSTKELICDDLSVFKEGCTVIPIHTGGFQNCDTEFDKMFVDDMGHVKDYRYYEQFKDNCNEIADFVTGKCNGREDDAQRIITYCGGIAIHDIYFAKKIYDMIGDRKEEINMHYPEERFWI